MDARYAVAIDGETTGQRGCGKEKPRYNEAMSYALTHKQSNEYRSRGFISPLPVFTPDEVAELRRQFEAFEDRAGGRVKAAATRTDLHLLQDWAWRAVTDPRIVDPITSVLGPNVLLWSMNWFIKEAMDGKFVSMHQDATYWGLEPHDVATAWVALSDAAPETGPMRFIPGSHKAPIFDQENTYAPDNLLSRGQTIKGHIDESEAVLAPLAAGEMSIHHVRIAHDSGPNDTDDRRIGMVLRYCATHVRQTKGPDTAVLVAGRDEHGHFPLLPPPAEDFGSEESRRHADAVAKMGRIILAD
jgi:chlorinating enzyme